MTNLGPFSSARNAVGNTFMSPMMVTRSAFKLGEELVVQVIGGTALELVLLSFLRWVLSRLNLLMAVSFECFWISFSATRMMGLSLTIVSSEISRFRSLIQFWMLLMSLYLLRISNKRSVCLVL